MTRVRVCAAIAALLTALLLQACVISALDMTAAVSLPALLVAAVALREGAGTGIAYGFSAGLVADLGSRHPAGVLALCWMGVGLVCGLAADRTSLRRDAVIATGVCSVAGIAATLLEVLLHVEGVTAASAFSSLVPTVSLSALLSLLLIPLTRRFLDIGAMRAPVGPVLLLGIDA
jgi:rod shape-determining protein MreD